MKDLHDAVAAEVGKVVVGQHEAVAALLAAAALGGHVLLEGPPGVAKTLMAGAVARALGVDFRRVQFTPDMLPVGPHRHDDAARRRARLPPGPGLHQRAAGRRDQPHAAQDPGGAAGGDAGAPGHRRRRARGRCPTRSWSSPPRTRSSTRAPTRCPRPSSTASWSRSTSATRARPTSWRCSAWPAPGVGPGRLEDVQPGRRAPRRCAPPAARSTPRASPTRSPRYVVAVVRRTRALPVRHARRLPARRDPPARRRQGRRAARRPRLRHPGRRHPHGAVRPRPPPRAHPGGRARALPPGRRRPHRPRRGPRPPMTAACRRALSPWATRRRAGEPVAAAGVLVAASRWRRSSSGRSSAGSPRSRSSPRPSVDALAVRAAPRMRRTLPRVARPRASRPRSRSTTSDDAACASAAPARPRRPQADGELVASAAAGATSCRRRPSRRDGAAAAWAAGTTARARPPRSSSTPTSRRRGGSRWRSARAACASPGSARAARSASARTSRPSATTSPTTTSARSTGPPRSAPGGR